MRSMKELKKSHLLIMMIIYGLWWISYAINIFRGFPMGMFDIFVWQTFTPILLTTSLIMTFEIFKGRGAEVKKDPTIIGSTKLFGAKAEAKICREYIDYSDGIGVKKYFTDEELAHEVAELNEALESSRTDTCLVELFLHWLGMVIVLVVVTHLIVNNTSKFACKANFCVGWLWPDAVAI